MLEILFSIMIIFLMIIIAAVILNYNYQIEFKYENNFILFFLISTSFYSYKFTKYSEGDCSIKKTKINFLGIKKEYIKQIEKDILNNKKNKQKIGSSKKKLKDIKDIKDKFTTGVVLASKENLEHIFFFIIDLLKELKSDKFSLFLNLSFSDPYYNGLISAYYYSIKNIVELKNFEIEVDWWETKFKVNSIIKGEIIPFKILFLVFKFIFSLQTIRFLVNFIKIKREKRVV
ncbi:MAG: hypothetical protein ACOCQA_00410 [bacterium]